MHSAKKRPVAKSRSQSRNPVTSSIEIIGARTHNLKSLDVSLPHDELVVITGPSGCGKSSLAIDTIFAEGQRQFIETLSVYTRQFLDQMMPADVDAIEGLLPTLKIDQHANSVGPRSTVGTITEIHDYLRVLFARAGQVHCHQCNQPIGLQTPEEISQWILRLPTGTKLMVLAPMVRGRKGKHADVLEKIRNERLVRVRVDGKLYDIDDVPELDIRKNHTIEAITDRIVAREGVESRLLESIDLAIRLTGRLVGVSFLVRTSEEQVAEKTAATEEIWQEKIFSTEFACANCEISYPEVEPRTFSFNSPHGACPQCQGLGQLEQFSWDHLIPNRNLSLQSPAIAAWQTLSKKQIAKRLEPLQPLLKKIKLSPTEPLTQLSAKAWKLLWEGQGESIPGLQLSIEKEWATAIDARIYETLEQARLVSACSACQGSRLGPTALAITLADETIVSLSRMSIDDARTFFQSLQLSGNRESIAAPLVAEILHRLDYLAQVGLGYLTIERGGQTLSGGELQRVRLAAAIGSGQTNVCFILDEPSIGLHSRDNDRLIDAIRQLKDTGNTVIVVEHDEAMMRAADRLIDMGPGSGKHGGEIVAQGTPEQVSETSGSLTGEYLSDRRRIPVPPRRPLPKQFVELSGASGNNLQNVTVAFPVGRLTCVTGVSGSGKSTLINRTLAPALFNQFNLTQRATAPFRSLDGLEGIEKFIEIDQKPIGRNSRSCPATYTGVFDEIRNVFAETREARRLGFAAGRFSFNSGPGRCPECNGLGEKKLTMNFLPDVIVQCGLCRGGRFNLETLSVRYRGYSIAQILEMPIEEAAIQFADFSRINAVLTTLVNVGLGYLTLGQSAATLSGGEAQRIKLATELSKRSSGSSVYLLDEPTTGLHFEDVKRLIELLNQLVEKGNTVIVIEHHLDVIKSADWVIDLGPEGGRGGGRVVAAGTPETLAQIAESHTGRFLQGVLP